MRYNSFHTTALCSPTRAALIAGRNRHSASTGGHSGNGSSGPPARLSDGWRLGQRGKGSGVPKTPCRGMFSLRQNSAIDSLLARCLFRSLPPRIPKNPIRFSSPNWVAF